MIRFRVNGRSGVPPYLQIVQQVRQALRMGVLAVGDQLPSVREMVAATAINPNTVLKAYRDLERDGLVEALAGHGTARSSGPGRRAPRLARTPGLAAGLRRGYARRAPPGWMTRQSSRYCGSRCRRAPRRTSHDSLIETSGLTERYRGVMPRGADVPPEWSPGGSCAASKSECHACAAVRTPDADSA
jgi:GntR family transcriptional regulator